MSRKYLGLLFLSLLTLLNCSFKTETKIIETFVFDNENILTPEESKQLDSLFRAHEERTTNEIVLFTTPDYGEFSNNIDFSVDFGNKYGIGKADFDNGVVIVFSQTKKEVRISTSSGTEKVLTDQIAKKMIDSLMMPKFKAGLYFEGLKDGSRAIVNFLDKPENKIKKKN